MQSVTRGIIRGFKAVKYDALIFNIIDRVAKISFFLISLALIYRLYGALIAFMAGALSTVILSFWLIRRRIFPDYRKYRRIPVGRELLSFSWPLALTGFTFLFVSKTDKIMLGYFMTSQDVGIYMPALVLSNLLVFVATAFKYIFLPVASEFFTRNDISGLERLYKSTSKWIFMVVTPLFLLILLFPKEIITILYGSEYTGGYIALVVLAFGIAMNDFAGTAGNILVGGGHTKLNLACEIIAAVTNVLLNIILIPVYGIAGAALATGISYITRNISSLSFVYRAYHIHPYKSNYIGILIAGLVSAGIVYLIKLFSPLSWWLNVFVLSAVFTIIYLLLSLLSRSFDDNDRVILEAIERKAGIRLDFIKKHI
jgi:O-antigen/teichoic acid export membrane protein